MPPTKKTFATWRFFCHFFSFMTWLTKITGAPLGGRFLYLDPSIHSTNLGLQSWDSRGKINEGCSKFFHLENVIFAKKKLLSPNFRDLHVFLSRYMLAKILRKTWMCDILKLFQASDPSSHFILRQLHLNIYVLL